MEFERTLRAWGEKSLVIVIPPDLAKHLDLNAEDEVILQDEKGKKGKYCSFWKKK